jgi:hypothetical protein
VAITGSWIFRNNRELNPIRFYLLESIISMVSMIFIPHTAFGLRIHHMEFNIFSFLDLSILYYYFRNLTQGRSLRRFLLGSFLTVAGICIYFWISPRFGISTFMPTLYGIQNLFITLPCLLYIYELFKSEEEVDLKTNPHFYIACGFLFFYATTFPFYMTYKTLYDITPEILHGLNSVQSFLSIILFFTILKAFLCPYPEQK